MSHQVVDTICSSLKRVWSSGRLVILTSAVVTLSVIGVRQLGALRSLELTTYDQMLRLRHDPGPDNRLLVVAITEDDIRSRHEYPLTDATIAKLLQTLEQHQPRAIGLDVIRDVPIGSGRAELTQTFQKSDRIIGVCKFPDALSPGFPPPPGLAEDLTSFADLPPDSGGVLRRALLIATPPTPAEGSSSATDAGVCSNPDYPLGSFALSLASRYLKDDNIEPELTDTEDLKLGPVLFKRLEPGTGPYKNAELDGYQILLNYRSPNQVAPQITLTDVLSGKVDPKLIQDRVVLIGYTAPSVKDEFITPYTVQQQNGPMPGVVAHAQIVSQLLSAVAGERSLFWFMPQWGEWLWILGWSVTGGIVAWRVRHPLILGLSLSAALGLGTGICFGILTQTGWIPLVPPALALIGTAGGVLLFDRFDKAAQAIYKGIKGFLKIDIDIDEAKKEEQVAQITDSTYFQFLEQRADELRNQKSGTPPPSLKQSIPPRTTQEDPPSSPSPLSPPPPSSSPSPSLQPAQAEETDYLQELQQKSEQQRRKRPTPPPPPPLSSPPSSPPSPSSSPSPQTPLSSLFPPPPPYTPPPPPRKIPFPTPPSDLTGATPDVTVISPTHPTSPTSPPPPLPQQVRSQKSEVRSPTPPPPPHPKQKAEGRNPTPHTPHPNTPHPNTPHPNTPHPTPNTQLLRDFDDYFTEAQQRWTQTQDEE